MMEGLITRSLRNDSGSSRQDGHGIAAIKSTNHGQQARACPEMDERGTRGEGKGHHCVDGDADSAVVGRNAPRGVTATM